MLRAMPKLFTLDEANALLPELRVMLGELRQALAELEKIEPEVAALRQRVRGNGRDGSDEPLAQQQAVRRRIQQQIARVQELGCELKDLRLGLIDFPSERGGEIVHLCWKLDEGQVRFWHPTDVGFAGRQPL